MKCFAYLSHAVGPQTQASVAELARESAVSNVKAGVTGVLAYVDGRFAQIVEGPREGVDDVLVRINNSRRHRDITVLGEVAIDVRAFPDWSMQCITEERAAHLEAIAKTPGLLPVQVDLIDRIVRFLRWEGR